jgi:hypothetical protein
MFDSTALDEEFHQVGEHGGTPELGNAMYDFQLFLCA